MNPIAFIKRQQEIELQKEIYKVDITVLNSFTIIPSNFCCFEEVLIGEMMWEYMNDLSKDITNKGSDIINFSIDPENESYDYSVFLERYLSYLKDRTTESFIKLISDKKFNNYSGVAISVYKIPIYLGERK